jgi:hypothetical protein
MNLSNRRARREYGSEEGRRERRERFERVIYGGGYKGDAARPTNGRLPDLRKAFDKLAQALNRERAEFSPQQGQALLREVEEEVQKLRRVVEFNARA